MMSATDELRALLDDAGVEWHVSNESGATFWTGQYGIGYYARENKGEGTLRILGVDLTPAQAVEATLGRGECHDLAETPDYRDKTDFKCSACGYEYSSIGGFGCDCGDEPDFNFCPNCGRRVVEVTA